MQKKIVLINDLSGFGRCSISVQLPILSVCRMECLLMPTALLSNHTAYPSWILRDLQEDISPWSRQWKDLDVHVDAILSGYLSAAEVAEKIHEFLDAFQDDHPLYLLDPAMADDGTLYPGLDESVVKAMRSLAARADILLPNVSEACLLCSIPYHEAAADDPLWIQALCDRLFSLGVSTVVLTGITQSHSSTVTTIVARKGEPLCPIVADKIPCSRPGTGDVFSAVFAGYLLEGWEVTESARRASDFVGLCLQKAMEEGTPHNEGVPFELLLDRLLGVQEKSRSHCSDRCSQGE